MTKSSLVTLESHLQADFQTVERLALDGSSSSAKAAKRAKRKGAKQYLKDWEKKWDEASNSAPKC